MERWLIVNNTLERCNIALNIFPCFVNTYFNFKQEQPLMSMELSTFKLETTQVKWRYFCEKNFFSLKKGKHSAFVLSFLQVKSGS